MHVQYFNFFVAAAFALPATLMYETNFQSSLILNLISRTTDLVFDARPVFICTTSTTCLRIFARHDRNTANNAWGFSSLRKSPTEQAAKCFPITSLKLNRPSVNRFFTDETVHIRISPIMLRHSSSVPLCLKMKTRKLCTVVHALRPKDGYNCHDE